MEKINEKLHLEKEWFKEAKEQTIETLPKFINHVMNDYEHDYGTICHAVSACALAAAYSANRHEQGGITGFQAGFVMWDFIKEWMYSNNRTALRIVNYDDMLYPLNSIMVQRYRLYGRNVIMPDEPYMYFNAIDNTIEIEIKQNKEDMEKNKLDLKPFDIQKAREGKPVCTRDGRKARIICFDSTLKNYPLVVLVADYPYSYTAEGKFNKDSESSSDLMMLPEKKEGWINVYKERCYETKEEAIRHIAPGTHYIDTIRVEWEDKE